MRAASTQGEAKKEQRGAGAEGVGTSLLPSLRQDPNGGAMNDSPETNDTDPSRADETPPGPKSEELDEASLAGCAGGVAEDNPLYQSA